LRGALSSVRVLDLTHAMAGPMCTMFLAGMGAEVLKIEPPWGEMTRFFPPLVKGVSPFFAYLDRCKKGITLNLKKEEAVKIFKELVKRSDVVVENFSAGVMDRLGLGYDVLSGVNPRIVFVSITGFGQTGPYSTRLSFDPIAQAVSGFMTLTGQETDSPGCPVQVAEAIGDSVPAMQAVIGILAALYNRQFTGRGQRIDLAQVDSLVSIFPSIAFWTMAGITFRDALNKFQVGPSGLFQAKDGYVAVTAPEGDIQDRLLKVMGEKSFEMPKFKEWVQSRGVDEVVKLLVEARIPVGQVLDLSRVISDPHVQAREMVVEVDCPGVGKVKMPGFSIRFSETPGALNEPHPTLGQHNEEVFTKLLGYNKGDLARLKQEQVI